MDPSHLISAISPAAAIFNAFSPRAEQAPPPDVNIEAPPQVTPPSTPSSQRPRRRGMQPSFLSGGMVPMQTSTSGGGGKTLLGQ